MLYYKRLKTYLIDEIHLILTFADEMRYLNDKKHQ